MQARKFRAPGRICLFGEHQDYLGFSVIVAAISKYITITASETPTREIHVTMPDINSELSIKLDVGEVKYEDQRDYLRSGYNILLRRGFHTFTGWNVEIRGDIPINAGTSSSSALVICWLLFLSNAGGLLLTPLQLANLGFLTEVKEFGEAGGMMDHFASSFGNLLLLETAPEFRPHPLEAQLGGFVLANSGPKRCTVDDLRSVKTSSLQAFAEIKEVYPAFDPRQTSQAELAPYFEQISANNKKFLKGQLEDRDLTLQARALLSKPKPDPRILGKLLSSHHAVLRDYLGVSTPRIEQMMDIALAAGGLGGKINGSGFGGCMYCYCPGAETTVQKALTDAGFEAWIVSVSPGATEI
jgi:galactokinase